MNLINQAGYLAEILKDYSKANDPREKKSIKKAAVSVYFEIEEELNHIKYDLRLIDIRNFKGKDKEQLKLFPKLFLDFEEIPAQQTLPHISQYVLPVPLLLFLFYNYKKQMPALTASAVLMDTVKDYLQPGDFQHLKSGGLRFITNTRFASDHLRSFGLLRTSGDEMYKYWQLTLFGTIIAAMIFRNNGFYFPDDFRSRKSTFFKESILRYSSELVKGNNFEKIIDSIFPIDSAEKIKVDKSEFISFLSEMPGVFQANKEKQKIFFNEFYLFLNKINDKFLAMNIAENVLHNHPSGDRYDWMMRDAFKGR